MDRSLQWQMQQVKYATLPAVFLASFLFGFGVLSNLLLCIGAALAAEKIALRLRQQQPLAKDSSAYLTGGFIALCLPPASVWYVCILASLFAIIVVKQLYGGLGKNLFNPAMAGFAFVLVSFPEQVSYYPIDDFISLKQCFNLVFGLSQPIDSFTAATALNLIANPQGLMLEQLWQQHNELGRFATQYWDWVSFGFLLGGVYLMVRKVIDWRAPIAMLLGVIVVSGLCYDAGSSNSWGSPLFHLFAGGTFFAAFFIVSEPVTAPKNPKAKLLYGFFIGCTVVLLRHYSSYADSIAFSILLANALAGTFDDLANKEYTHAQH